MTCRAFKVRVQALVTLYFWPDSPWISAPPALGSSISHSHSCFCFTIQILHMVLISFILFSLAMNGQWAFTVAQWPLFAFIGFRLGFSLFFSHSPLFFLYTFSSSSPSTLCGLQQHYTGAGMVPHLSYFRLKLSSLGFGFKCALPSLQFIETVGSVHLGVRSLPQAPGLH